MVNIITLLALLLLAALFIYAALRARRARRAWMKWPGMLLSGLLAVLLLAVSGLAAWGLVQLSRAPYTYSAADVQVARTPEQLARGERLAYICVDCHSSTGNLPLDGSLDNLVAGGPPIGTLYGPNLTPGGPLQAWTDGEIIRAIREGVSKTGRPLLGMTSEPFHHLSDQDVHALVAYLRSQPPVARDLPPTNLNLIAAVLVGAGLAPTSAQPPLTAPIIAPAAGSPAYGQYLVYASGCRDCHGAQLTGGTNPLVPAGPDLTVTIAAWSEAQFTTFLRTGVNNTGRAVDNQRMPWKAYSRVFTDAELDDIYAYLTSISAAGASK